MRMRKLMPKKKSAPRSKKSTRFAGTVGAQAIFLVVIGVVAAAAMLIAARQSSQPSEVAAMDFQQEKAANARAKKSGASEAAPAGAFRDTTPPADVTAANLPAAEPAAKLPVQMAAVTITGCLEHSHETFRLKDTSGVEAAKSRSWKSGFFKKSPASIEVVDAANRLQLQTHVGQRVSVTGMLVDREMQGRSLKRIAASCDIEPVQGAGIKTVARGF
jgi:Tfp pilus assembly protein PilV